MSISVHTAIHCKNSFISTKIKDNIFINNVKGSDFNWRSSKRWIHINMYKFSNAWALLVYKDPMYKNWWAFLLEKGNDIFEHNAKVY